MKVNFDLPNNITSQPSQVAQVVKNPSASAGEVRDVGFIPRLGISLGGGHDNPLQYPCLENPMNRGAWQAIWSIGLQRVSIDTEHLYILNR